MIRSAISLDLTSVTTSLTIKWNVESYITYAYGTVPKTTTFAEPSLSKKGLYSTLSQKRKYDDARWLRMNLIAYSDGKTNIFKIAELLNEPLDNLCKEYSILKSKKILK